MEYFEVSYRKESIIVKAMSKSIAIARIFKLVYSPIYKIKISEFTAKKIPYNMRVYVDRRSIGTAMTIDEAMEMVDKSLLGKDFEFREPCGTLIYKDFIG